MEMQVLVVGLTFLSLGSLESTDKCEREISGGYGRVSGTPKKVTLGFLINCTWEFESLNGLILSLTSRYYTNLNVTGLCNGAIFLLSSTGVAECDRLDIGIKESGCSAVYHESSCNRTFFKYTDSTHCSFRWKNTEIAQLNNRATMDGITGWVVRNGTIATYKYKSCSNAQPPRTLPVSQNISATATWTPMNKNSENEMLTSNRRVATISNREAFYYAILGSACTLAVISVAAMLRYCANKCGQRIVKINADSELEDQTEEPIPDVVCANAKPVASSRKQYEEITLMPNSPNAYEAITNVGTQEEIVLMETPRYQAVTFDEAQTDGGYEAFTTNVATQEETVLMETPGYQAAMLDEAQTDGGYEAFTSNVATQEETVLMETPGYQAAMLDEGQTDGGYEAFTTNVATQEETVLMETPGYQAVMLNEAQTNGGYEIFMLSAHAQD